VLRRNLGRLSLDEPVQPRGAQVAALTSTLLIAQQVAGKAARDALFLSSFHTSQLPLAMASGAVLSLVVVYWLSRLMVTHAPAAIVPLLFAASACGFGLEWIIAQSAPRAAALLVYFQTAALGPVMISTFWSLINERFDPHTAKRAVARIAGGGTLGGVLGGLAAWRASSFVEPVTVLLFLALLNALAVFGTLITRARHDVATAASDRQTGSQPPAEAVSPLNALRNVPFLRHLALLVLVGAVISALLDYVFSAQAAAAFEKGQPLLSFFSLFWLAVGVLSFLLQMTLGRIALEKLGLAVNIAILPGIIILGGGIGLAVPGLASASLLRGAEAVQRNTLFRSAYELLYTPVPEEHKRTTKAVIDVGFDRLGTIAGSGVAVLALHALSHGQASVLLAVVVVLALATLPVTRKLHLGYVEALEQGLREGAARLQLAPDDAAASGPTAPDSHRPTELEREKLIERVEVLQPGGLTALLDGSPTGPEVADTAPAVALEGLTNPNALSTARDLLSSDAERVKLALGRLEPHGPGVACAILLLAHPDHHQKALEALRANAPLITGQLLDALLDSTMDFVVRRRIPRALQTCSTQRSADGLLLGIADERFEVRYECGRALTKVTDANAQIVISQPKVLEAIQREIENGKRMAEHSSPPLDGFELDEEHALVDGLMRDRVNRSLEHMFTILSLVLEREPLRMAFRALHHEDDKHRGTALEYLYTVLPAEIREIIWPYLGEAAPLPTVRAVSELLEDLARAEGTDGADALKS
jgi:AAA family ATP:ADP antiporter